MITGRPVQAIVLSHEKAQYLERDPYLPWLLRPLPKHVLLGYTAESPEAPKGPKHFCVIRWFQEAFFLRLKNRSTSAAVGREIVSGEPVASHTFFMAKVAFDESREAH